jgi:hypothetical protein
MSTNTVHLHRVLTAKPEKIYGAFLDRDAMLNGYHPMVILVAFITWMQR